MTTDEQLRQLMRLTTKDGLTWAEHHDIGMWWDKSDCGMDTTLLTDLARERIAAIHARFFSPDGA